jgi:hypothetical protein
MRLFLICGLCAGYSLGHIAHEIVNGSAFWVGVSLVNYSACMGYCVYRCLGFDRKK